MPLMLSEHDMSFCAWPEGPVVDLFCCADANCGRPSLSSSRSRLVCGMVDGIQSPHGFTLPIPPYSLPFLPVNFPIEYFGVSMTPRPPRALCLASPKPRMESATLTRLAPASPSLLPRPSREAPTGADSRRVTRSILEAGEWNATSSRMRLWRTSERMSAKVRAGLWSALEEWAKRRSACEMGRSSR
jgi:hypothetical protein